MIKAWLLSIASELLAELKPVIVNTIAAEVQKQIPVVIHAVVIAITETLGKAAEQGVDKVTDLIPGQLDDQLFDPIMARVNELLKGLQ